jgi:cysteine desulfuration protein SufE
MPDPMTALQLPPSVERVLRTFRALGREEKMQTLLHFAKRLEPLPDRFRELDRAAFTVPECQTRVDLFPEVRDGNLFFYADLNARQSPTVAAFLAILFSAVNGHPPATTLAVPGDFVRQMMDGIGLEAMLARVKRHAQRAIAS